MKRRAVAALVAVILYGTGNLFGAGVYQNQNQSADFVRTINRNASTDIDAAYFNPAATAFLKDGLYLQFNNQIIKDRREAKNSSPVIINLVAAPDSQQYAGEASTLVYPDFYVIYKTGDLAFFTNSGVIGAGASADFSNGLPMFDTLAISYIAALIGTKDLNDIREYQTDVTMNGLQAFLGQSFGSAYKLSDSVSAALGFRYIYAITNEKVSLHWVKVVADPDGDLLASTDSRFAGNFTDMSIDASGSGHSFSFFTGLHFKPLTEMNIGWKFEYHTDMEVVNNTKRKVIPDAMLSIQQVKDNLVMFDDGYVTKITLPPMTTLGISYLFFSKLKLEGDFTYFFNRQADWGYDIYGKKIADKFKNGYDLGSALEYTLSPSCKVSSGFTYSVSGRTNASTSDASLGLDAITVGLGFVYSHSENLEITCSAMHVIFKNWMMNNDTSQISEDQQEVIPYLTGKSLYSESTWVAGFSISYKINTTENKPESSIKAPGSKKKEQIKNKTQPAV